MSSAPSYSLVNTEELAKLASLNASGSVFAVYSVLCAYARKSKSCFPSISTIVTTLGGAYHRATIQRALAFLEAHKIIKRGKRRSINRFQMTFRQAILRIKNVVIGNQECRKDAPKECRRAAPKRKQEGRRKSYIKKSRSSFLPPVHQPTKEDKKEELIARFILNDEISSSLHSLLGDADWCWLETHHPIKAARLRSIQI